MGRRRPGVIRLWVISVDSPAHTHLQDMIRFNEAIDEALAESTAAYAEQVNRSRDIFLAILGHDLRAPLQAVSMSTEMLERKAKLDANSLNYVAAIKNGARHMGAMVSDLLEFVRSRLGSKMPIETVPMDLAQACQMAGNRVMGPATSFAPPLAAPSRRLHVAESRSDGAGAVCAFCQVRVKVCSTRAM